MARRARRSIRSAAIQYHSEPETAGGFRAPWGQSPDNPVSPNFVDLARRGEYGRARWWALHARRSGQSKSGVFDG